MTFSRCFSALALWICCLLASVVIVFTSVTYVFDKRALVLEGITLA